MSHARKEIVNPLTLSDFLRLNFLEHMTLNTIKDGSFDEKAFFSRRKSLSDLGYIIKMAHASSDFANMCKKDSYNQLWSELYVQLGLIVSLLENKQEAFYKYADGDNFDLLRGTYFFYLSQQMNAALPNEVSVSELNLLKEAIRFNSVHALQRYNSYLYKKVAQGAFESNDAAKDFLTDAIKNSSAKPLLKFYGSYAYMLLVEAFYQFALWAKDQEDIPSFRRALQSASHACENASKLMDKSEYLIHNTSFGNGLGYSNSLGIDSPERAKEQLEQFLETTLANVLDKPRKTFF